MAHDMKVSIAGGDVRKLEEEMKSFLIDIVRINSDSINLEGIREVQERCIAHCAASGFHLEQRKEAFMVARRKGEEKPAVLMLGHLDTCYNENRPMGEVTQEGEILRGHGVADMKGGITVALFGLRYLKEVGALENKTVTVLFTSDEETGSYKSRAVIEEEAKIHDLVYILEPGKSAEEGKSTFVIERKGLGSARFLFNTQGEKGWVSSPGDASPGVSAGEAAFHMEFPFKDNSDLEKFKLELDSMAVKTHELQQHIKQMGPPEISIHILRPPMIPLEKTLEYSAVIERISNEIGHPMIPRTREGLSDGCFTAGLGIPTLDGMGPVGGKWHTEDEYLETPSLIRRTELFVRFWQFLFGA